MGWTTMAKPDDVKAFMDDIYGSYVNKDEFAYCVLASTIVRRTEYYCAVEKVDRKSGNRVVFAGVAMLAYTPRDRDGFTFGYKDMTEKYGPVQSNCPARILDLLTETSDAGSIEWRARCRAMLAQHRAVPKLVDGMKLRFADPIHYAGYGTFTDFTVVKHGAKVYFTMPGGTLCRITRWKDRKFDVITEERN